MGVVDDHTAAPPDSTWRQPPPKKQRLNGPLSSPSVGSSKRPIDLTHDPNESFGKELSKKPSKVKKTDAGEKRLRVFRKHAPKSYLERYERAQSQRMFVIKRERQESDEEPKEVIEIAGTTGNIYTVTIKKMPTCTCPDSVKGNQCKHVIYIVCNVLKAPTHLRYQLAYLSTELREIFSRAQIPGSSKSGHDPNRKSLDGECPVCFMEFGSDEEIVYCKSSCGNNVHKECFQQWAQAQAGREIRCIYCRAHWKCDDETRAMIQRLLEKRKEMAVNGEGYINMANELGLSGVRDYSTYHQAWVVRRGRSVRYGDIY